MGSSYLLNFFSKSHAQIKEQKNSVITEYLSLFSIKKHFPKRNITSIFGCGGDRDIKKRKIMGQIADKFSNKVIFKF